MKNSQIKIPNAYHHSSNQKNNSRKSRAISRKRAHFPQSMDLSGNPFCTGSSASRKWRAKHHIKSIDPAFLQSAQKIFILFLCPFMRTFRSATCHSYFFGDMAGKQQGVHVLLGIDHPVLIECPSAFCQYHCRQTVVLSHNKVIFSTRLTSLKSAESLPFSTVIISASVRFKTWEVSVIRIMGICLLFASVQSDQLRDRHLHRLISS